MKKKISCFALALILCSGSVFANENNADLVIRIHADGSEDSSVTGASLHIPAHDGKYTSKIYEESNKCAQIMFYDMKKAGFKVIGVYDVSNEEHISNMKEMCDYYCTRMDESIELLKIEN